MTDSVNLFALSEKTVAASEIRDYLDREIDALIESCADAVDLPAEQGRRIIARYTAVLEGNFIYWMTATYLAVRSREAQAIIEANLREEVRDNHPGMLRRFATAARAIPTDTDRYTIDPDLQEVRAFVAKLATVKIVAMMAFFEGFIARFMPVLAALAVKQGSKEMEYTDVHGVVDVAHTQGLLDAYAAECAITPEQAEDPSVLEGVRLLRKLIHTILGNN